MSRSSGAPRARPDERTPRDAARCWSSCSSRPRSSGSPWSRCSARSGPRCASRTTTARPSPPTSCCATSPRSMQQSTGHLPVHPVRDAHRRERVPACTRPPAPNTSYLATITKIEYLTGYSATNEPTWQDSTAGCPSGGDKGVQRLTLQGGRPDHGPEGPRRRDASRSSSATRGVSSDAPRSSLAARPRAGPRRSQQRGSP